MRVSDVLRARRPHSITALEKHRRDLIVDILHVTGERNEARAEAAKLSIERKPLEDRVASLTYELANAREDFWKLVKTAGENADQFAKHTEALVQERDEARAEVERLPTALKSVQRARDELQLQVDELRADRDRLQGLIDDLVDEPTAKQVQDMLRTWATELDWSAGCFDSAGRDNVSAAQRVLVVAIERIGSMSDQENSYAND